MKTPNERSTPRIGFSLFNHKGLSPEEAKAEAHSAVRSILLAAIGGVPIAGTVTLIKGLISNFALSLSSTTSNFRDVYEIGVSAGVALLIMLAVLSITPYLWRKIKDPKRLVFLAYLSISLLAIGISLLFPGSPMSIFWLSWWLGGVSTAAWWTWEQRWRGLGLAPSPLAGVLRPEIFPGQIWFASVQGKQSTKVRPVLVLDSADDDTHWKVAYFTTQKPKYARFEKMYLSVPNGSLRGIASDNWVSLVDLQSLSRGNFRTYTGLAPTWLYEQVVEAYGLSRSTDARTIDEETAGKSIAPSHKSILSILGLRKNYKSDPSETISWKTAAMLINLPIESKDDRRSRSHRQNSSTTKD
jgi:hypothetical protein